MAEVQRVDPADFNWGSDTGPAAVVRRVVAAADAADSVVNLNEEACLHLKHRGLDGAELLLADGGFALARGPEVDVVVHPDQRGRGLGRLLAEAALPADGPVSAWSHGDHPAARALAASLGLARSRELWVMRRPLDQPLPDAPPVHGVRVRTFTDGDAEALVDVNAHAFAQHPEQGHMSVADFRERQGEDWFDPEGLFLAVPVAEDAATPGRLLGFHWTKVHPEGYGEVYVVAVSPKAAGRGIGTLLTHAGLAHLRSLGLPEVILYVDGDNAPAIAVYRSSGFEHLRTEAQYTR